MTITRSLTALAILAMAGAHYTGNLPDSHITPFFTPEGFAKVLAYAETTFNLSLLLGLALSFKPELRQLRLAVRRLFGKRRLNRIAKKLFGRARPAHRTVK